LAARSRQLLGGVQQGAARGEPGGVDQAVDPAVPVDGGLDRGPRTVHVGHVGPYVVATDLHGQGGAGLGTAAGHDDGCAFPGGGPGNCRADTLGSAADQHDPIAQ
jgi:hypothetical protein